MIAVSFAFKLQAVFLMPVFLIFLFARRMKWLHLLFFPLTYLVCVLPAILLGRPAASTILLYFDQAGTVGSGLNYNSPSAFAFLRGAENPELLSKIGIAAAFVFLLVLYVFCFFLRKRLNDHALLTCSLLICVAVPFLLPHMHDRYFFMADALSVCFAVVFASLAHVPVLVSFASLMGYCAYLTRRWFLDRPESLAWGAAALLLVILTLIAALAYFLSQPGPGLRRGAHK
jgi:Gpi18-like mannosyltransferase